MPRVSIVGGDVPPPKPHELLRLLRDPDGSIVLDLSQLTHSEKLDDVREVLPQITLVRQRTGLPHRMLIDEAHYFLRDEDMSVLCLESGGYMAVTYRASRLHPDVLKSAEVILVSRATDPREVALLADSTGASAEAEHWNCILNDLAMDEAAILPGAEESCGRLRRIRLVQRVTSHVRHRAKYMDVPVANHHAFAFTHFGRPVGATARTLQEFIDVLASTKFPIHDHLQHGDFSKWIGGVFGDRQLAATLRRLEVDYQLNRSSDINDAVIHAIRSRYDLV